MTINDYHIFFFSFSVTISVGVLEDKFSYSRILEDNFEVLGLGLGLEACVLDSITGHDFSVYTSS